jgi:hypothetical protein
MDARPLAQFGSASASATVSMNRGGLWFSRRTSVSPSTPASRTLGKNQEPKCRFSPPILVNVLKWNFNGW